MPCYQRSEQTIPIPGTFESLTRRTPSGFATEADCLNACREGACCEGTTCSVKPACQCQGAGEVFRGVGTTCTPNPCGCCGGGESLASKTATIKVRYILDRPFVDFGDGACRCTPIGFPDAPGLRCWDYNVTFNYVNSIACQIACSGDVPGFGPGQFAYARVVNTPSGCRLNIETSWAVGWCLGPLCGSSQAPRAGYSFSYVADQSEYIATYYIWSSASSGCAVITDSNAEPSGVVGGLKATITVEVALA
jgi:hypothetical protein